MYSVLQPVAEAVFAVLGTSATLAAALAGGVHGTLPPSVTYPCLWVETFDERDIRGFGTGGLPEIELRLHTYSRYGSLSEAQEGNRIAVGLLKDAALTITGYTQAGRAAYRNSVTLQDELLAGLRVHEIVSIFTIWADEVST